MKKKTVIVVCGPTAVGKTAISVQLAQLLQTSIVSADSRQCFREMTIGVAKPSFEEMAGIPHYFINTHSIHEQVDAGIFESYALDHVKEIFVRNDFAIMVGGTGLYIKAFCEGMDDMPAVDASIRHQLKNDYEKNGLEWLQHTIQSEDADFWSTAEQQNPQRLLRALEVKRSTGKSINYFKTGTKTTRDFNIIKTGLELPREDLNTRINLRVDEMINNGLVAEAASLVAHQHLNALQTVGYKELFAYFNETVTLDQAIESIKKNTRHYAKRQMTWFKKDPEIQWFSPDAFMQGIETLLKKG